MAQLPSCPKMSKRQELTSSAAALQAPWEASCGSSSIFCLFACKSSTFATQRCESLHPAALSSPLV